MIRKILYIFLVFIITLDVCSAAKTASSGAWGTAGTWSPSGVPGNGDDVVIPNGVVVTTAAALSSYNSITVQSGGTLTVNGNLTFPGTGGIHTLTVSGNLNVTGNTSFNQWEGDQIDVKSGGNINISGNLSFPNSNASMSFTNESGAVCYIGGTVSDGGTGTIPFINSGSVEIVGAVTSSQLYFTNNSTGTMYLHSTFSTNVAFINSGSFTIIGNITSNGKITNNSAASILCYGAFSTTKDLDNYGYIEVTNDFTTNSLVLTNYASGVIVVHGNIPGSGGTTNLYNYGIITADHTLNMNNIYLYNKPTGRILVTGDILMNANGKYMNEGYVQCDNFTLPNLTAFSNTGTTVVLKNFNVTWGGCPCNAGNWYLETYSLAAPSSASCVAGKNCDTYWSGMPKVTSGRKMWLSSDFIGYGLSLNNDKISKWFDLANSYGFKLTESNTSLQPTLKNNSTDNLNFNPVMSFSTGEKHLDLDANYPESQTADGGLAIFAVVIPDASTSGNRFISDFGNNNATGYGLAYSANDGYSYTSVSNGGNEIILSNHGKSVTPTLLTSLSSYSAGSQSLYSNGTLSTTTTGLTISKLTSTEISENSTATGSSGPFTIGGLSKDPTNLTNDFEGKIAEYILYARNISTTEQESNQSFLALKYGITLPHNYRDYYGNIIRTVDATYSNDIAGLARDDLNHLHQRQSKSINSGSELTVSTGAIASYDQRTTTDIATNSSYLIWAHNGLGVSSGQRIYQVTAKNFNQAVNLQFTISGLSSTPNLIIADDAAFTVNVQTIVATSYIGGNLLYNATFGNNKIQYCKIDIPIISPGGISDKLNIWLKADAGVKNGGSLATDGQVVNTWIDQSGARANNATDSTGTSPTYRNNSTSNINYNPCVEFNGSTTRLDFGNDYAYAPAINGGLTILATAKPDVTSSKTSQYIFDFGLASDYGYSVQYGYENMWIYSSVFSGGANINDSHTNKDLPAIIGNKTTFGLTQQLLYNGLIGKESTITLAKLTSAEIRFAQYHELNSGPMTIGRQSKNFNVNNNNGRYFDGRLPEVILYTKSLNTTELQKVESYLAVKYGITLSKTYVNTAGITIWDRTTNGVYHNDVAGIIRDDLTALYQKQSKSVNTDDIVAIGLGSIATTNAANANTIGTDKYSMLWGNNNGATIGNITASLPAGVAVRLQRIWKVAETGGDVGNTEVRFDLSNNGTITASDLRLLIDKNHDGSFSDETVGGGGIITGAVSNGDNTYSFSGVNFADADLFCLGSSNSGTTPLKVITVNTPGVGMGNPPTTIDASAELQINSTDKGILLPSLTTAQINAITNPPNGLIVYNSDVKKFMYNTGNAGFTNWQFVGKVLLQTSNQLTNNPGCYNGEMRYNTTTNTVWYWDSSVSKWREISHNP